MSAPSSVRRLAVTLATLATLPACSTTPESEAPQVVLSLEVVPSDVQCIRLTVAGPGRTLVRELVADPGKPMTQSLSGLPLGSVTCLAEAFTQGCEDVSASTIPTWVSDLEHASIVLGRLTTVELTMHRNGRAKVAIGFADEAACSVTGSACNTDSECCSHDCVRGACAATPDAGADAR